MLKLARTLLLFFAFTIPWEYSLVFEAPFGNIARLAGIAVLLAAIPALIQRGSWRRPGAMLIAISGLYLWSCLSYFWSTDPSATFVRIRGYFEEMMIVWLVWELVEKPEDLRDLIRAYIAGSWVLALLTIASVTSPDAADQVRFVALGQDPNDVARFLDLGLPFAALLVNVEDRWLWRLIAGGYLPLGLAGVLLTASRSGFLAASAATIGSVILLGADSRRRLVITVALVLAAAMVSLMILPPETLARIATIPEQLTSGDLNQRLNIWAAGVGAFARAPFFGHGAGSFVAAAGLAPEDTAHNTVIALAVEGGVVSVIFGVAIIVAAIKSIVTMTRPIRTAHVTALAVWLITSSIATVHESRSSWLLFAWIAVTARLVAESPSTFCFVFPHKKFGLSSALAVTEFDV